MIAYAAGSGLFDRLVSAWFGRAPLPPDPTGERFAAIEALLARERDARQALALEVKAESQARATTAALLDAARDDLKAATVRIAELEKDNRLLRSTIDTLHGNAGSLTAMLTEQGGEIRHLMERMADQRRVMDADRERLAIAEQLIGQSRDETTFWQGVAAALLTELNRMRAAGGMEPYASLEAFAAAIRAAYHEGSGE